MLRPDPYPRAPRTAATRKTLDRRRRGDYLQIMQELLRSTDPTIIAYASALLEGEDIDVFALDVHMSILEGSIGILPRRLMVRDDDLARARIVLSDNGIPTGL
jgi:hypothetical protein